MERLGKEYIYFDGMYLREEQLLKLALNVGNYMQAEHYLFALLAHGALYGCAEMVDKVNQVREHYGVPAIPTPEHDVTKVSRVQQNNSIDDKARAVFMAMSKDSRRDVLRTSLHQLRSEYHLFKHAIHWLGVYLVIRDRLEGSRLKMKGFICYANQIIPEDWPVALRMNENTYKNFGKLISYEDRSEAYYDMAEPPQVEISSKFWGIVKDVIFTT